MENPRPEKVAIVDEVRDRVASSEAVILTEYRGLSVSAMAELRAKLSGIGGDYKVYKNTLVRIATRSLGSADLDEMLNGPTALAFVRGDIAEVAKTLRDFGRTNPALVMKGGLLGDRVFSAEDASKIANLEPREVMLAKFAGLLQAPMQQFAGLIKALVDKNGGAPAAEVTAEAPATEEQAPAAEEQAPAGEAAQGEESTQAESESN